MSMFESRLDLYDLPGGGVLVSTSLAGGAELAARDLLINGRPPGGGWLFHQGRTHEGGVRCSWIGRPGPFDPQSLTLSSSPRALPTRAPLLTGGGFSISGYLAGFANLVDRIGLVRKLVERAPTILGIKGDAGFDGLRAQALTALLRSASDQPPQAMFRLPGGLQLLMLSGHTSVDDTVAVHVLDLGCVGRSMFGPVTLVDGNDRHAVLLVQASERAVAALVGRNSIVSLPMAAVRDRFEGSDLVALIRNNPRWGADLARYLLMVLAPYADNDQAMAALLEEIAALMPVAGEDGDVTPSAELSAAFTTPGGVLLVAGKLHDPDDLIARIEWSVAGSNAVAIPRDSFHVTPRAIGGGAGFVATAAIPSAARRFRQHRLALVLRSGARMELVAPPAPADASARRDLLLTFLHDHPDDDRLFARLQPLVAELHTAHLAGPRVAEVIDVGALPADPAVSIVIPLYRTLTFLRQQASAFAIDPALRDAEVILVLDSPEQRDELLAILDGLQGVYGFAARVAVHHRNLGYGPAVNSGAALAHAPKLVLMNSDVVPADTRWLPALLGRYRKSKRVGAVGPKLLYGDDSLQHAGLTFARDSRGRYYNTHFFKGYPRDFPKAARPRQVPGLTGACLMIERGLFQAMGGISEDYVVGDFEDSDLSLRLAEDGFRLWYEPAAELYHYERESILRNESYTDTAACRYNQFLHTSRWQSQLQKAINSNLGCNFPMPIARSG